MEVAVTDIDDEGEELGGVYAEVTKLEVERIELSGCGKACKTDMDLMGAKLKSCGTVILVETGFGFAASAEEPDAWQEGFNTFLVVPPAGTYKWESTLLTLVATSSCNTLYFSIHLTIPANIYSSEGLGIYLQAIPLKE